MIPKKIHYCWFGRNPKPKLAEKCINSWKKYCSDYEIVEWNEDNFDINKYPYAKYCLDNQKYAFLSDFARLIIISEEGGIYFDTDVEVVRNFDDLLSNEAFYGFENNEYVATGLGFGAEKKHVTVIEMLKEYDLVQKEDEIFELKSCPQLNTAALLKLGLQLNGNEQVIAGAHIYPTDFFNPFEDATGILKITKNTHSIHWYAKSWISKWKVLRSKLTRPLHRIFGVDFFRKRKNR